MMNFDGANPANMDLHLGQTNGQAGAPLPPPLQGCSIVVQPSLQQPGMIEVKNTLYIVWLKTRLDQAAACGIPRKPVVISGYGVQVVIPWEVVASVSQPLHDRFLRDGISKIDVRIYEGNRAGFHCALALMSEGQAMVPKEHFRPFFLAWRQLGLEKIIPADMMHKFMEEFENGRIAWSSKQCHAPSSSSAGLGYHPSHEVQQLLDPPTLAAWHPSPAPPPGVGHGDLIPSYMNTSGLAVQSPTIATPNVSNPEWSVEIGTTSVNVNRAAGDERAFEMGIPRVSLLQAHHHEPPGFYMAPQTSARLYPACHRQGSVTGEASSSYLNIDWMPDGHPAPVVHAQSMQGSQANLHFATSPQQPQGTPASEVIPTDDYYNPGPWVEMPGLVSSTAAYQQQPVGYYDHLTPSSAGQLSVLSTPTTDHPLMREEYQQSTASDPSCSETERTIVHTHAVSSGPPSSTPLLTTITGQLGTLDLVGDSNSQLQERPASRQVATQGEELRTLVESSTAEQTTGPVPSVDSDEAKKVPIIEKECALDLSSTEKSGIAQQSQEAQASFADGTFTQPEVGVHGGQPTGAPPVPCEVAVVPSASAEAGCSASDSEKPEDQLPRLATTEASVDGRDEASRPSSSTSSRRSTWSAIHPRRSVIKRKPYMTKKRRQQLLQQAIVADDDGQVCHAGSDGANRPDLYPDGILLKMEMRKLGTRLWSGYFPDPGSSEGVVLRYFCGCCKTVSTTLAEAEVHAQKVADVSSSFSCMVCERFFGSDEVAARHHFLIEHNVMVPRTSSPPVELDDDELEPGEIRGPHGPMLPGCSAALSSLSTTPSC